MPRIRWPISCLLPGIVRQITEPNGIGVRVDSYVYEGYEIPVFYDPMIGKLIVWATCREYAIERMRRVLFEYKITGVKTNIAYLRRIMDTPDFVTGGMIRDLSRRMRCFFVRGMMPGMRFVWRWR